MQTSIPIATTLYSSSKRLAGLDYSILRINSSKTQLQARRHTSNSLHSRQCAPDSPDLPSRRTLQAIPTTTLVRSLIVLSATVLPAKLLAFLIRTTKNNVGMIESLPPLRWTFKRMLYDNFCIGLQKDEILSKTQDLRRIGFTGIALANAREAQPATELNIGSVIGDFQCEEWVVNNLQSVQQAEPGDYVGLRFTGAGTAAAKFLSDFSATCKNHSLEAAKKVYSAEMKFYVEQVKKICAAAEARQVRVLIDAESSTYQRAIDCAALQIMAHLNTSHRALVLNTYQMYLKSNIDKVKLHLQHSVEHNYVLGIKMVRGAYLHTEMDKQSLHISKQQTDEAYDATVRYLLQAEGDRSWKADVLLATHNAQSVQRAFDLYTSTHLLAAQKEPRVRGMTFAQLMGMADEVSMDLVNKIEHARKQDLTKHLTEVDMHNPYPRLGVYKYTAWGSLRDCLLYILRRAEENKDAAARTQDTAFAVMRELRSRVFRRS
ncbi:FAD-linked oxidoreductase [Aureobasidium subglaciale]|nr:FAD-linked oxidoreductase [Aureobasidium subglaciale]